MRGVIVALLVLSLSGCLVLPEEDLRPPPGVAASELLDEGRKRAREPTVPLGAPEGFTPHAAEGELRVAAIYALESVAPHSDSRLMGANYHLVHRWTDDALGDGRAPAWGFLFRDDSIYTLEEELSASDHTSMFGRGGYPTWIDGYVTLGGHDRTFVDWSYDSVDAAEKAALQPEWQEALANATTVASILYLPEGQEDPFWLLGAHDRRQLPLAHVLVNARTGELADVWAVHPADVVESSTTLRVDAFREMVEHEVAAADTSGLFYLRLSLPVRDPLAQVAYQVVDAERTIQDERTVAARGTVSHHRFSDNAPFTVTLDLRQGVLADVQVDSCVATHRWMHLFGVPEECGHLEATV